MKKKFALYGHNLFGQKHKPTPQSILGARFIVPPFSVLNGTSGFWRDRRRKWDSLGFNSVLGRPKNMMSFSSACHDATGGNDTPGEFCPVLCELVYRWFCPAGGTILDPFCGGSVRGIVASVLGYQYRGVDLREEQVAENRKQAKKLNLDAKWFVGDSRNFDKVVKEKGDFIFSSPPYFGREHHCDLPEDLNNSKNYELFLDGYRKCIAGAASRLRDNRFAAFEVNEIRIKGVQVSLIADTIRAFADAGMDFYNHAIHLKSGASARIRTNMFVASRKLVPIHEHVLVFLKGDYKLATEACGQTDFGELVV